MGLNFYRTSFGMFLVSTIMGESVILNRAAASEHSDRTRLAKTAGNTRRDE